MGEVRYIVAGIDGTGSKDWASEKSGFKNDIPVFTNSHVNRFVQEFNTTPDLKKYFHGPETLGSDVPAIAGQVLNFIENKINYLTSGSQKIKKENIKVVLVGHSRGGHIAIMVSNKLENNIEVEYLGLFDAVDREISSGKTDLFREYKNTSTIRNARFARHAVRDWKILSRVWFMNTGRRSNKDIICSQNVCAKAYVEMGFHTSHGGMGGDPEFQPKNIVKDDFTCTAGINYKNVMIDSMFAATPLAPAAFLAFPVKNSAAHLESCMNDSARAYDWIKSEGKELGLPFIN